jgi:hypothetical protein
MTKQAIASRVMYSELVMNEYASESLLMKKLTMNLLSKCESKMTSGIFGELGHRHTEEVTSPLIFLRKDRQN